MVLPCPKASFFSCRRPVLGVRDRCHPSTFRGSTSVAQGRYTPQAPRLTFTLGARLGPYEILSAVGAGGMGEVYRARDTRLGRDVAIKILPDAFALDPERVARFKREAQVLASLDHPHIAQIYGIEESGPVRAIVMELVGGRTLAALIAGETRTNQVPGKSRGLGLADALSIARQLRRGRPTRRRSA